MSFLSHFSFYRQFVLLLQVSIAKAKNSVIVDAAFGAERMACVAMER